MDSELSSQVIEFAEKNRIDGYFVNAVIKTSAKLKHEYSFDDSLFPTMVLSSVGKKQKELITEDANQLMNNNADTREEYNLLAAKVDFEKVPEYIRRRFPKDTDGWKNKDIAINTRWVIYFDRIIESQASSMLQIVDKIIKVFRPQILQS
jgi:hypothetical protein